MRSFVAVATMRSFVAVAFVDSAKRRCIYRIAAFRFAHIRSEFVGDEFLRVEMAQRRHSLERAAHACSEHTHVQTSDEGANSERTRGRKKIFPLHHTRRAVFGRKGRDLQSVNARTVRHIMDEEPQSASVLCGDGETINGALCDRFRIRFRTRFQRTRGNVFLIGFVHGEADNVVLERTLGQSATRTAILLHANTFHFYCEEKRKQELSSSHLSGTEFPAPGQEWIVEFDFVTRSFCLYLLLEQQWVLATKTQLTASHIVPGFSLFNENDTIEIVDE